MLDHVQGTLTASSALTVDSNKALDDLNIGNNASTGGSIELKEGTNNGTHHVQLKAPNSLGGNVELTLPSGNMEKFLKQMVLEHYLLEQLQFLKFWNNCSF